MSRSRIALAVLVALPLGVFAAGAAKKATVKLDIKPADVHIYVDDKSVGMGGKPHVVSLAPGRHTVKLVRKGVTHEETLAVKAGENKNWAFDLGGDKDDQLKIDEPQPEQQPEAPAPE